MWREVLDAQFLAHLASQGIGHILAIVDVASAGSVPFARLNVLPFGTLLQVELAFAVDDVQVNHWVELLGAVVGLATKNAANHVAIVVDKGKQFFAVIHNESFEF